VADIYNLPFSEGSFDIVICEGVFQVVSNAKVAIEELKRVLKKDGLLIINTLNALSIDTLFQKENILRYNPYKFKSLMKEKGFDKIKIKGVYMMPSFLDFLATLIIKLKINHLFNLLFPFFAFFSHAFYIEGRKK